MLLLWRWVTLVIATTFNECAISNSFLHVSSMRMEHTAASSCCLSIADAASQSEQTDKNLYVRCLSVSFCHRHNTVVLLKSIKSIVAKDAVHLVFLLAKPASNHVYFTSNSIRCLMFKKTNKNLGELHAFSCVYNTKLFSILSKTILWWPWW